MQIRVLGSYGSRVPGHQTTCMLINDRLAIDAGGLTAVLSVEEQAAIDHVLISHAHLDHVYDLAFMVDNVMSLRQSPLKVWAPAEVLQTLKTHLFNGQVWPDMSKVSLNGFPVLSFCELPSGAVTPIDEIEVHWARTEHTVFSAGYVLTQGSVSVLFSGDTTSTDAIWALGRESRHLAAVFVEVSFPDRLQDLALETGHLTPGLLTRELVKLDKVKVPVKIFHMKPQYLDEICQELEPLKARCEILQGNEEFTFARG